ncbi:MAG TPA: HNH endonuclease signature motif containing protein, partial [Agromyces mariniharenae]|nr:HNH endonuclease signature motif containing protein [Agromyces mariniharenae]
YDRTVYRVPADLAGYLRVRDGTCRFPGCSRRAVGCDIDHTRDWATGGDTRHDNLAHLCRTHHRLKHNTRWRMSPMPSGDIRWTSPAGHEYMTSPEQPFTRLPQEPPWATAGTTEGLGSDTPTSDAA